MNKENLDQLLSLKQKLVEAVRRGRSRQWCLTLWSRYIRARDLCRCVSCKSSHKIQAHHIFRKVVYPKGSFELGNGITLCHSCHRTIHAEFNGRPDLNEPLNAKGGDDQDEIAYLYGILLDDAQARNLNQEEFYYICDEMLQFFVAVQGYEEMYWLVQNSEISRIHMSHEIWRNMPEVWYPNVIEKLVTLNAPFAEK